MNLSTFVKNLRIAHSLTTTEMAHALNVSVSEWSEAELKSDLFFLKNNADKIAKIFNIELDIFISAISACHEYENTGNLEIEPIEHCIASLRVDKQLLDRLFRGLPRQGPTKARRQILKMKRNMV